MLKSCHFDIEERRRETNKTMKHMISPDQKPEVQMGDMGKLYDEQAPAFAEKAKGLVWWETIGKEAYNRHLGDEFYGRQNLEIADLGSASARVEEFLIDKGIPAKSFTGVEISPDQVKIAQQRIPEAEFIVGDISEIKLPKGKFNLVFSNMVFEFLSPDKFVRTMENTAKALKPDGTLFYITTHPDKMKINSGLEEPGVFTVKFPWGGEGPNYYRTKEDFIKATEEAGFKIQALEDLNLPKEAEQIDPDEYKRYMQYPNTRLVIKAVKK